MITHTTTINGRQVRALVSKMYIQVKYNVEK
jgi:hypothetical protein